MRGGAAPGNGPIARRMAAVCLLPSTVVLAAARPYPRPAALDTPPTRKPRVAPPQVAFQAGLMPLASTGMSAWRIAHPQADGRGVLIAILDGGTDPAVPGLLTTSTGEPKTLDVRDFSGENDIPLARVRPDAEGCVPAAPDTRLCDAARIVAASDTDAGAWAGVLREITIGKPPFADLDGDGTNHGRFGVLVVRRGGEWVAIVDADGDGSLEGEAAIGDYLTRREWFTFTTPHGPRGQGLVTAAINLEEREGRPRLAIVLGGDHGTHVAGIAAGHAIYGVPGFDGVAPGAQIISLKISNNARGGVSTTGSMLRAMEYAYRFAAGRRMPLVMNLSFGVGNADEGRAVMDSIVDDFLTRHPDVFFAIAAGNDGPGTSTLGEPGSAELAVTVGAAYPAPFAQFQFGAATDVLGWWSGRGGELAKPDLVTPGLAYSTVPAWEQGGEIKGGTSMATPYVSGLAAVLISALREEGRAWSPAAIAQALRASAQPFAGEAWIDQGAGLAQVDAAYRYLEAGHEAPRFHVEALPATGAPVRAYSTAAGSRRGANRPTIPAAAPERLTPGAYRRGGLAGPADTVQRFRVTLVPDSGIAPRSRTYRLVSDAPWLRPAAPTITLDSATRTATAELHYAAASLRAPGRYSGAVRAIPATDSAGGPAFVLVNTVVVPDTVVRVHGARGAAASEQRYYVAVPQGAAGFPVVLTAADSAAQATLNVFEPTGRPARGDHEAELGGGSDRTAVINQSGDDLVPGIYEVVVQTMPGRAMKYDLVARVAPVRAALDTAGERTAVRVDVAGDTALTADLDLIGATRSWTADIRGGGPWSDSLLVPAWAKKLVVEVEVTPDVWDQVTDFGVTVYDTAGNQLGNGAMNYPFHRVDAELPAQRPDSYRAVVELSPGFASPAAPAHTAARVRVRAEGEGRRLLASRPVARAAVLAVPDAAWQEAPPGWQPLVRLRVGSGPVDRTATTQRFALPARP